jgi:hypothetical protein
VIHGNRGRPCKRKVKEKTVSRVVALARGKYQGFNDHRLTEKLKEQEQIELSREKYSTDPSLPRDLNAEKAAFLKAPAAAATDAWLRG